MKVRWAGWPVWPDWSAAAVSLVLETRSDPFCWVDLAALMDGLVREQTMGSGRERRVQAERTSS